jgi:HlyD family secretion protein
MKRQRLIALAVLASACSAPHDAALQGYAEGEFVRVAAPFAGTLVALAVRRGDSVSAGAPLFTLESENETAARREAQERLARARAQLANQMTGKRPSEIDAVRAQLAQAQAAAALSDKELARQQDLSAKGFGSRQRLDETQTALARDRAHVEELKAQLATAGLASRPEEIRAAQAEASAAEAALAQADWRLRQRAGVSAVSGVVVDTLFVKGEWVGAGQPVVTLLPPGNLKARFHIPEPRLGAVKVGQAVDLRCEGCGEPIKATITWISPQAEYTPPVIYSKESRTKLVFLAEATPSAADAPRLKPGQPIDITLR